MTHLWQECQSHGIDLRFHAESFWVPKPVRVHDVCIMDIASTMYTGRQLHHINMCRLALKVMYLSDITSVDGRRVLLAYHQGKAHKESGRRTCINWPPVGQLPTSWWERWQEFLMRWCGTGLRIPNPLGGWYESIEHLTQCCFWMYENRLIVQQCDGFFEFDPATPRAKTRFSRQAYPFRDTDLLAHAQIVDVSFKSSYIYVISRSNQNIIRSTPELPTSGITGLYQSLSPEVQRILSTSSIRYGKERLWVSAMDQCGPVKAERHMLGYFKHQTAARFPGEAQLMVLTGHERLIGPNCRAKQLFLLCLPLSYNISKSWVAGSLHIVIISPW